MKTFPNRLGLCLFVASVALNVFLVAGFAGGFSGAWAFEQVLKKRLAMVTAPLPQARQAELEAALARALQRMQPQTDAVREAQRRWLTTFERSELSITDLRRDMLAIRQHREAANAVLHDEALSVIAALSPSERQAVAAQIRQRFDVGPPQAPAIAAPAIAAPVVPSSNPAASSP
jgi:uncharacterized membrane protein